MDQERYQNLVKKCTEEKLQVLNEFSYAAKTIDRDFVRFEPRTLAGDLVVVYVVRRGKNGLVRLGVNVHGSSPASMMIDIIHKAMM